MADALRFWYIGGNSFEDLRHAAQRRRRVKTILSYYESDNPGTKANLARILMHGKLGGTGKVVILPVDQGFEHGPAGRRRSFRAQSAGL